MKDEKKYKSKFKKRRYNKGHSVESPKTSELSSSKRLINHVSILQGKRPVGFDDLDFEIVREIKNSTK